MTSKYESHEYAELFPMMEAAELEKLAADVKDNGLAHPLVLDQHGRLVDGRNRQKACEMAGVEPATQTRHFADDAAVLRFVVGANVHRRHLSESQRAMIAAQVANLEDGQKKSDADRGRSIDLPAISQADAAEMFSIGEATVRRAAAVHRNGTPELRQAVKDGEIKVSAAAKIATLPPQEQTQKIAEQKEAKKKPRKKKAQEQQQEATPQANGAGQDNASEDTAPLPRVGVLRAQTAIATLRTIPKNDALRKRGFQLVRDWLRDND